MKKVAEPQHKRKKPREQKTEIMTLITRLVEQIARADAQHKPLPPRIRLTSRRLQRQLAKLMLGLP